MVPTRSRHSRSPLCMHDCPESIETSLIVAVTTFRADAFDHCDTGPGTLA